MNDKFTGEIRVGMREYIIKCVQCNAESVWHGHTKVDATIAFKEHDSWVKIKGYWHCRKCAEFVIRTRGD